MGETIVVDRLRFAYGKDAPVLVDVSLSIASGSLCAIIGPNGIGKSTLLRLMAGLVRADSGTVRIHGDDPRALRGAARARAVAWLPQRDRGGTAFNALELVLMGRFPFQGWMPFDRDVDVVVARQALERVGVAHLAERRLSEMSGGERQRVHLARALAQEPRVLLLDEPATALDLRYQAQVWRLLSELRDSGLTLVVVSHDLNYPGDHADHVVVLGGGGQVVADGRPEDVLRARVLEPVFETSLREARAEGRSLPYLLSGG